MKYVKKWFNWNQGVEVENNPDVLLINWEKRESRMLLSDKAQRREGRGQKKESEGKGGKELNAAY